MADEQDARKERHRSPNYPAVSLPEAVERVRKLVKEDGKAGAPTEIAAKHIGYSSAHGSALSTLAALKKFALVTENAGRIVPTQRALEILNLPEGDPRRRAALRDAALSPSIYRELVEYYKESGLPGEESLQAELKTYRGFNPKAVAAFVTDFIDSLNFAGINVSNALDSEPKAEKETTNVKVGDYVQWEPNGILQFREPRRVREITDGYAFVDGSPTGMPIAEVTVEQPPANLNKPHLVPRAGTVGSGGSAGMRQDVFSVTEGDVVLSWPASLTADSIQEIKDWLKIAERKIIRSGKVVTPPEEPAT